jgi:molybdopterin-containing oxidoreductase family iron-sulfur binding subunit
MEKCTFCTQRIERVKIQAATTAGPSGTGRSSPPVPRPARPRPSPFGDLNDEQSAVRKLQTDAQRAYGMLEELNTRPRLRYLARVRNT